MNDKISKYIKAQTIAEAINIAADTAADVSFLAGGTDLVVNKLQANNPADCLIDISGIQEMKLISLEAKHLKIGPLVTLDELKMNKEIANKFPVLVEAAESIASPVIRKSATIGGNLLCENRCIFYNQSEWWREAVGYCLKCEGDVCIATGGKKNCFSKFVSDMGVALISLDACIEIVEKKGTYTIRLEDIYTGDGVNPRKIGKTSLIKNIYVPANEAHKSAYKKLRKRETMEFSSLTTAVTVNKTGKIKIVLGGVDPKPIIVEGKTGDVKEELIKAAVKKSRIVDNDVFSREYRKEMIEVFLEKSFKDLSL